MVRCPVCGSEMKIEGKCEWVDHVFGLKEYRCVEFKGLKCRSCGFELRISTEGRFYAGFVEIKHELYGTFIDMTELSRAISDE